MTTTPGVNPGSSSSRPPYSRPALALGIAAVAYVIVVLLGWPGLRAPIVGMPAWAATLVESALTLGPLLIAALLAARWAGPGVSRALGIRFRPIDLLLGALVALVARAVMELLVPTTGSLRPMLSDGAADVVGSLVTAIVALVLLSPVVEELFFRGLVQRALQTAFIGASPRLAAGVAIALTTAAFVILHAVPYGAAVPLDVVFPPLLIGIGAGVLTATTGRIAAGLVAHVLFNLAGVILLLR